MGDTCGGLEGKDVKQHHQLRGDAEIQDGGLEDLSLLGGIRNEGQMVGRHCEGRTARACT